MILIGIALFVLLVIVHELGHFIVAKRNGVEAEEFGIGFPPKLFGKVMGKGIWKTEYSLNLLPLGGFVRLKGESSSDKRKGSFGAASFWVKTKITLAGVVMNFLTAALIFTILAAVGLPVFLSGDGVEQFTIESDTVVTENDVIVSFIEEDSPADEAGIEFGDQLLSIAGETIEDESDVSRLTKKHAGETVTIITARDDAELTREIALRDVEAGGNLGVVPTELTIRRSTWSAPITGFGLAAQSSWLTLKGIGNLFVDLLGGEFDQAREAATGPVGIVFFLQISAQIGTSFLLVFIATISIALAVMNALPIPALDGGRLFVTALFIPLKKYFDIELTEKRESFIHGSGFVFLIGLVILITVFDVQRFF